MWLMVVVGCLCCLILFGVYCLVLSVFDLFVMLIFEVSVCLV